MSAMRRISLHSFVGPNKGIILILAFATAIRWLVVLVYGQELSLHSDDQRYVQSAQWLLQYGTFSYYNPHIPTVHMMPGIVFLLAGLFSLFGTGTVGILVSKLVMSLIGVAGIYGIFLLGKRVWSPAVGLMAAVLTTLYLPDILTGTLSLTETPFSTALIYVAYYSIRAADEGGYFNILLASIFYALALYFRPTIALLPVLILVYFVLRRVSTKKIILYVFIVMAIVVVLMAPWWIRNAIVFHHFIPFTDGSGNPLLLGTYQGIGYPEKLSEQAALNQLLAHNKSVRPLELHEQQWMKLQSQLALHRMSTWWHTHPGMFLESYLWAKPKFFWADTFYWIPLFNVPEGYINALEPIIVTSGLLGWMSALFIGRKSKLEALFVILTLFYFTIVYSLYFAYGRYSEPLIPLVLLGICVGVYSLAKVFKSPYDIAKRQAL